MADKALESILIVFQNPAPGRLYAYDDWYTNVHIRDALRIEGGIATQRFIAHDEQLVLGGRKVTPAYWTHTVYEWQSAAKSVIGHRDRACTPLMEITSNCSFEGLRDYFYRPEYLSHGWTEQAGFRRGDAMLTALIVPPAGADAAAWRRWFADVHAPATLALPGVATAGLFSLHEEQSLAAPFPFTFAAIYGLTDAAAALAAWSVRQDEGGEGDLAARAETVEATCWQPRIARLTAAAVATPTPQAKAQEVRAREAYKDSYLIVDQLNNYLGAL